MALRLGDHVVAGELFNVRPYSTHGWLALRGEETPLLFELTGDCGPDLKGRHIRFSIPEDRPQYDAPTPLDRKGIAWRQIGPTGDMLIRQMLTSECSHEEYLRRSKDGEEVPTQRKPCLSLEWYSQNGRVVLELVDPDIEWVDDAAEAAAAREAKAAEEVAGGEDPLAGPGVSTTEIRLNEEGEEETQEGSEEEDEDDPDDPYGLFPPGFDEELSATGEPGFDDDSAAQPLSPPNWRDMPGIDEATARLYESWDEVVHQEKDVAFTEIFDPPLKLLTTAQLEALDDAAAETALKELLMRLALLGVSISVCEHYTPRTTYRLLVDEILPKNGVHPNLNATGFVQGYMTSEYCSACDAEFEREDEERERERKRNEGESDDSPPAG